MGAAHESVADKADVQGPFHFDSIPPVPGANGNHGPENRTPSLGFMHRRVRKHAAVPTYVFDFLAAQPDAGRSHDIEFAVGIAGQAVATGFVVRSRTFHGGVVLRDMEIDHPRAES